MSGMRSEPIYIGTAMERIESGDRVCVDPATGRVRREIGYAQPVANNAGDLPANATAPDDPEAWCYKLAPTIASIVGGYVYDRCTSAAEEDQTWREVAAELETLRRTKAEEPKP